VARGKDTGNHPGRKADNWKPRPGNVSNSRGNVISAKSVGEEPYSHALEVTQHRNSPGFSVDLDLTRHVNQGGIESEQYRAGPYRTQRRAEIAGDALHARAEAESETAANYQVGEYYESADEIRANKAGLL